jgi:hypothetical protein
MKNLHGGKQEDHRVTQRIFSVALRGPPDLLCVSSLFL